MDPLDEIEAAYNRIEEARSAYRQLLRTRIAEKAVTQVAVSGRLGRSGESLRQDAMTDEERREEILEKAAARQAALRAKAKNSGSAPTE